MKYTKGEWATSPLDNTKVWACDSDGRKVCVAWSTNEAQNNRFYPNKTQEEMESNAKLIAAAPDLLEALMFAKSVIKKNGIFDVSDRMAFEKALKAIKKATL
jgi:hypothetical protein